MTSCYMLIRFPHTNAETHQMLKSAKIIDPHSANPRMQCSECGRWMRMHGKRLEAVDGKVTEVAVHRFYGGCSATGGGDVCSQCCPDKCRERLVSFPKDMGGTLAESADD